jgi:carbamoyl-phosphate synthase (ammonia)
MSSTGEVACFGPDRHDAFLKSLMSTGMKLPKENILVSIQERLRNERTLPTLQKLEKLGYKLFATPKTAAYLTEKGIKNQVLHYAEQKLIPSIDTYIEDRTIDAVFMFSNQYSVRTVTNYAIRRLAVDYGVPLITNIQVAEMFADAMEATRGEAAATGHNLDPKSLQEWYSVD